MFEDFKENMQDWLEEKDFKRHFLDNQIRKVKHQMAKTKVGTEEYRTLLQLVKELEAEKKKKGLNINWDGILKLLEVLAKIGSGIVVPVLLSVWMYNNDQEMHLKNKSMDQILQKFIGRM